MIILDTDHISALQYRDSPKAFALQARLETLPPDDIATTVRLRPLIKLVFSDKTVRPEVVYRVAVTITVAQPPS